MPSSGQRRDVVAVVGATGQQGGATARALLTDGVGVRALVRDPDSPPARSLCAAGAELVTVDLGDGESLRAAFDGLDRVFAMTTMIGPAGTDGEIEMGRAIADAAVAAGVAHVLYSSVGGAERHTGIPHFESKRRVEEYLANPDAVPGGVVEIAGDELTAEQVAAAYGERAGTPARFEPLPVEVLDDPDMRAMFTWFRTTPNYRADRLMTDSLAGGVQDFTAWLAVHADNPT